MGGSMSQNAAQANMVVRCRMSLAVLETQTPLFQLCPWFSFVQYVSNLGSRAFWISHQTRPCVDFYSQTPEIMKSSLPSQLVNLYTTFDFRSKLLHAVCEVHSETVQHYNSPILFVAFVKDNATMSSIQCFENHVSHFVQNQRKKTLLNSFLYDK